MPGELKTTRPKYLGMYRALVESNEDPDKLGRIQARVYPMFDGITAERLPWAVPAFGLFEGAGENIGFFSVPDAGTFVFVFFEEGDPYQPVYFANAPTGVNSKKCIPADLSDVNYPNRKVWRTSAGIEIYIDDTDEEIKVRHPAEVTVTIDKDGNVEIVTVGKIDVTAEKTMTFNSDENLKINTVGNVVVNATGNIVATGAIISLN